MSDDSADFMNNLLRQAQSMQEQLLAARTHAESTTVEGQAGGGLVTVTATGGGDITRVRIRPDAVDSSDVELLEDLVLAAIRDALTKAKAAQEAAMGGVMGDLGGLLGGGLS